MIVSEGRVRISDLTLKGLRLVLLEKRGYLVSPWVRISDLTLKGLRRFHRRHKYNNAPFFVRISDLTLKGLRRRWAKGPS